MQDTEIIEEIDLTKSKSDSVLIPPTQFMDLTQVFKKILYGILSFQKHLNESIVYRRRISTIPSSK